MKTTAPSLPLPRLEGVSFSRDGVELPVLTDSASFDACGTRVAFTTRHGGVSKKPFDTLNLGDHVNDVPADVDANRRRLVRALGAGSFSEALIVPNQVHGTDIVSVGDDLDATCVAASAGADAIVCTHPRVPVLLCFADCVPLIMLAPNGSFAVAHAGWRGAVAGIAAKALRALSEEASVPVSECNVYVGPHIGSTAFEVGEEVLTRFESRFPGCGVAPDASHVDLSRAVITDCLESGADERRIADCKICTVGTTDDYFSYRASGGHTGRHGAFAFRLES